MNLPKASLLAICSATGLAIDAGAVGSAVGSGAVVGAGITVGGTAVSAGEFVGAGAGPGAAVVAGVHAANPIINTINITPGIFKLKRVNMIGSSIEQRAK